MISNEMNTIRMKEFTFVALLKSCAKHKNLKRGINLHDEIIKKGFLEKSPYIATCLITMYAKCRMLPKAKEVIEMLPNRNVVSWNALIAGYAQEGQPCEALNTFEKMQCEGLSPDSVTFICTLKACGILRAIDKGKEVHDHIARSGLLGKNVPLGNALIDMYAKCGLLEKAQQVFDELCIRNVVSWSTLIIGYSQHGKAESALNCFKQMQEKDGITPNEVTLSCVLKACGNLGILGKGKQIHDEIIHKRLLGSDIVLSNGLIDMYAKCGALLKAQEVFDELPFRDVVSWSSLLAGYAQHGHAEEALNCFQEMQKDGFSPTTTICLSLLSAFSHSGLLDEGIKYFENMSQKYDIMPTIEHYACMVDLLARAGCLVEAIVMAKKLPCLSYLPVWDILIGASQKWGNVAVGRLAFEYALELNNSNVEAYVSMSNIYAVSSMRDGAKGYLGLA